MDITVYCSNCGQKLVVDDSGTAMTGACPACQQTLTVDPHRAQYRRPRENRAPISVFLIVLTVLAGVLLILQVSSVVASKGFCSRYMASNRELRTLQRQATLINNNRTVINALVNETVEYSKKNPTIIPILESAGLKGSASASTTTK